MEQGHSMWYLWACALGPQEPCLVSALEARRTKGITRVSAPALHEQPVVLVLRLWKRQCCSCSYKCFPVESSGPC